MEGEEEEGGERKRRRGREDGRREGGERKMDSPATAEFILLRKRMHSSEMANAVRNVWQTRLISMAKETYFYGKRDLFLWQMDIAFRNFDKNRTRPAAHAFEVYVALSHSSVGYACRPLLTLV